MCEQKKALQDAGFPFGFLPRFEEGALFQESPMIARLEQKILSPQSLWQFSLLNRSAHPGPCRAEDVLFIFALVMGKRGALLFLCSSAG